MQSYLGEKFTTDYVVTGDTKLYAVQTEVEGPSDSRKYIFNLTDKFFYAEDHEAFNPTGGVWHDKQHGWVFANGDQIELLVGKKANINFTFCQYSAADATISSSDGQSISAVTEGACGAGTLAYEGEEGKLTLTINASGSVYIHDITIFNTTTTNYDKQGDWLIVKQGDASSFLDAIEAAKGIEGAKVFLPNGTYDLGETVKTSVSGTNVSIIGQSAENIIPGIDLVVYTAAIHPDNPEFAEARSQGLPMLSRAELLGQIMDNYKYSIAVSGTHGKTTTTAMLAHILLAAEKDPAPIRRCCCGAAAPRARRGRQT